MRAAIAAALAFGLMILATLEGTSVSSSSAGHSLQIIQPGPTSVSNHNHLAKPAPYTVSISDANAEIKPGKQTLKGIARGMRNVAVIAPAGGRWHMVKPEDDGSFSVDIEVPDVHGPMTVEVHAWDSPPDTPGYKVHLKSRFDLFVVNKAKAPSTPLPEGHPAHGMSLVWADEFDGPLSASSSKRQDAKWFVGGKPSASGAQYSQAYFVRADDDRKPFWIKDGFLRIRATHDPEGARNSKPGWWSGHLSSGFPDEGASIEFREGYAEVRMKTPLGAGTWPAFWLLDSHSTLPSRDCGAVEIDVVEAYGHEQTWYMATQHRWPGPRHEKTEYRKVEKGVPIEGHADRFHTYGIQITKEEAIWYLNGKQVFRSPLYRAEQVSPFFLMLNLSMGGGWPILAPPSGYYDLWVDYVRVYRTKT